MFTLIICLLHLFLILGFLCSGFQIFRVLFSSFEVVRFCVSYELIVTFMKCNDRSLLDFKKGEEGVHIVQKKKKKRISCTFFSLHLHAEVASCIARVEL